MFNLIGRNILIFDIETDSLDVKTAKLKWFGAYSYMDNEYYEFTFKEIDKIMSLLLRHKNIVSFNGNDFDIPIIENNFNVRLFNNKIDLFIVCKQRLPIMGIKMENYKLKTIVNQLKLNEDSKGDIDYEVFKKDEWSEEESINIKKYLRQDIVITKCLFEYFNNIFNSITSMLSKEDNDKLVHIKSSPASLSYRAILSDAGIKYEFLENNENQEKHTIEGGHHIEPRTNKIKGNIVSLDFTSMYPHMVIMCNLLSSKENGWSGNDYIKLNGKYDDKSQGKIEQSLNQLLIDRLKAKKDKNLPKNMAYKILINSFYGTIGNSSFKTVYNPVSAGDCTRVARTIIKRLARTLEENGFDVLYGFTDSVIVRIPEESSKEELIVVADSFIKDTLSKLPFPKETFRLEVDKEIKFICFFSKNCYLYVTKDDEVKYTSTLLNKNVPEIIMKFFQEYMTPKIINELDISFTEQEIRQKLSEYLKDNLEQSAEEFNSRELSEYKVKSSLEYQISNKYGSGKHKLIPNIAGVGVGKAKGTKSRKGLRYCTFEEFKKAKLEIKDIDMNRLIDYLKLFFKINKKQSKLNEHEQKPQEKN